MISSEEQREEKNNNNNNKNTENNRALKAGGKTVCHWSPRRDKNLGKIMTQNFPNLEKDLEI